MIEHFVGKSATLQLIGDLPERTPCGTMRRRSERVFRIRASEIVRLYRLRNCVELSYKQMKDELGWADFMVRKGHAIRGIGNS